MSKKKNAKQVKSKTSSVKQRNRLRNKGKIKTKKHISKSALLDHLKNKQLQTEPKPEEDYTEDVMEMMDKEDIDYIRKTANKPKIKKSKPVDIDSIEDQYESSTLSYKNEYNTKMLLPIKTKEGIQRRFTEMTNESVDEAEPKFESTSDGEPIPADEISWLDTVANSSEMNLDEPVSVAKIFAKRDEIIQKYKFRIGLLASTLLENPELKIGNLTSLIEIMEQKEAELQFTVKKLVTISLLEIFKDLLPAYQIKHQNVPSKKLKKVTQQLVGYESQLLKNYKDYLRNLENMAQCLRKKKGDNRTFSKPQIGIGILAIKCLTELLIAHPYFNFSDNIVHLLTLYLDNPIEEVRKIVEVCYKKIFQEDKRGFISLVIVRRINYLVKTRAHSVHCEALAVLLSLRIKNVNLDQEKEEEIKNKHLKNKRQKVLSMSKKERKRKKELVKLDREMLEVEAEENKKNKQQHMTEIIKIVFLIYFRILKTAPRSNLLSITLEGVAKFTHCINLEYYQDLVNILNYLLEKEQLNIREQLYCIKTVFIILSGQEEIINIDPLHFYTHLYRIMLDIHAGKTYDSVETLLSTLETVLVHRRKKVSTQRMLSFTKRLGTLALQLLHNGSLGSLSVMKSVIQLTKAADLLLDVESNYGQGVYNPELNEPEYCNAGNTALWELCALSRHYHPITRKMSIYVSNGAPTLGNSSLSSEFNKMTSTDFCTEYDPSSVAFKPAISPPIKINPNKQLKTHIAKNNFIDYCTNILHNVEEETNFSLPSH